MTFSLTDFIWIAKVPWASFYDGYQCFVIIICVSVIMKGMVFFLQSLVQFCTKLSLFLVTCCKNSVFLLVHNATRCGTLAMPCDFSQQSLLSQYVMALTTFLQILQCVVDTLQHVVRCSQLVVRKFPMRCDLWVYF